MENTVYTLFNVKYNFGKFGYSQIDSTRNLNTELNCRMGKMTLFLSDRFLNAIWFKGNVLLKAKRLLCYDTCSSVLQIHRKSGRILDLWLCNDLGRICAASIWRVHSKFPTFQLWLWIIESYCYWSFRPFFFPRMTQLFFLNQTSYAVSFNLQVVIEGSFLQVAIKFLLYDSINQHCDSSISVHWGKNIS